MARASSVDVRGWPRPALRPRLLQLLGLLLLTMVRGCVCASKRVGRAGGCQHKPKPKPRNRAAVLARVQNADTQCTAWSSPGRQ